MTSKDDQFHPNEIASIQSALQKFEANQIEFDHPGVSAHRLLQLWDVGIGVTSEASRVFAEGDEKEEERREETPTVYRKVAEPRAPFGYLRKAEWLLGMSDEFVKAVQDMDRKLQGRILEAISYISAKPIEPKGDTVKPLTGEFKGLWRYRIGDYRLVYWPDAQNKHVVLVDFTSRAEAYN